PRDTNILEKRYLYLANTINDVMKGNRRPSQKFGGTPTWKVGDEKGKVVQTIDVSPPPQYFFPYSSSTFMEDSGSSTKAFFMKIFQVLLVAVKGCLSR